MKNTQLYRCDICKSLCVYDDYYYIDESIAYNKCYKIKSHSEVKPTVEWDICSKCILESIIDTASTNLEVVKYLDRKAWSTRIL